MESLAGRNAVVVGGGSGIGQGIALALAGEGVRVLVADIHPESAAGTVERIVAAGGRADAAVVDGTDAASLAELAAAAADLLGPVHVLVNTVGVMGRPALSEATDDEWDWFLRFHLLSPVRTVRAFVPGMRAHGEGGHIVVTASMAGLLAMPPERTGGSNTGCYTTVKHALVGYGEMLRAELAPDGIGVSVLCPGLVESNLGVSSGRNRSAALGGPVEVPVTGMPPGAMANEECGRIVVRGIRADRAVIITHPDTRADVEARQRRLLDDYDFAAGA